VLYKGVSSLSISQTVQLAYLARLRCNA
jgi:hypothetical protein